MKLSVREMASKASSQGEKISASYIALIEEGHVKNVSPEKLRVIAKIYDLTFAELLALAQGRDPDENEITEERLYRINFGYEKMPPAKKKQLDPLIDLLEREYKRLMEEKEAEE